MRVLILTDRDFTLREAGMVRRLEIGLADEGVRVIRAVPEHLASRVGEEVYAQLVTYEDRGFAITRSARASRLVEAAASAPGKADDKPFDVVHVFGESAWGMGIEVARQAGSAVAIELFQSRAIGALGAVRVEAERGLPVLVIAADAALQRRASAEVGASLAMRTAPWGVHMPRTEREILRPSESPSLLVVASGLDRPAMTACIEGVAGVAARHRELVVFIDADAAHRAGAWPVISSLGLADRVALIPEVEHHREPALRADLLALPEALGDHRSITLDAMAAGMGVVAATDPMVSCLIDQQTARLVKVPSAPAWSTAIGELLDHPATARTLGRGARSYLAIEHKASQQIASIQDAYEWLVRGGSIPYRADAGDDAGH